MRNVSPSVTEDQLKEKFAEYGSVERVKKLKDYAFIHFVERDDAVKAMEGMNSVELDGLAIEVSLAKPQPTNKEKRRGGQSGFGALNSGRGSRGGPPRGAPPGRGRGGYGGGDRYGYDGYDRGYGDHYEGYGGGYGPRDNYSDRGYGDNYYDDYYGGGGGGGYGYDRYSEGPRGGPPRGGRGAPSRGGRGGSFPGRGGDRGGRGSGPRGGPPPRGGRGGPPPRGGPRGGGVAPAKRKYGADSQQAPVEYPEPKRRFMGQNQSGSWGSQPIAQQPLYDSGGYGNQGSNQEWYSDSNWQQW